ncbi:MAG: thioesterase family protein [Desulfobacteraceae bacterium]|nr:thioesterase family protein [Desulfobacteraceae bacterium]
MDEQPVPIAKVLDVIARMYETAIPFNKVLGLKVDSMCSESARITFDMQPDFIGNYIHHILHGGVISSVLDATGGITATMGALQQMEGKTASEIEKRVARIGTIDLRVDYLRPGRGNHFVSTGKIMRAGRRVAVARMELANDEEKLIAVGTGTYIIG